jgi:flagellar hook-associated protein 3
MITSLVINNLSRNIDSFMKLENMMSTGRRINKPSDDPIGSIRDLGYRSVLAQYEQYDTNISHAETWLSSVDLALSTMNDLLIDAKDVAVMLANDTYDETARQSAANEVESIFEQILQAGNSKLGNRYLFSGQRTLEKAFRATSTGVIYEGDDGDLTVEIEASTRMAINIVGSDMLTKPFTLLGDEADLAVGVDGSTALTDLNDGNGVDLTPGIFRVTDANLGISIAVDLSAATDLNSVISAINTQLQAPLPPNNITNLTASLGDEGNNLKLVAIDRSDVSLVTPLRNLNQGAGIDRTNPSFIIHNADHSIEVTVDIASATTLGDVVTAINSVLSGHPDPTVQNVVASLNAAGTGLMLQDNNGVPIGLTVSDTDLDAGPARDLGIIGSINPQLVGTDLNPRPEFVIEESASGETTAADLGITGTMNYNLVGEDVDPRLVASTPVSLLNNGVGIALDRIRISQGGTTVTLDLNASGITTVQDLVDLLNSTGLSIRAAINSVGKGISIENLDPTQTLIIKDIDETKPAAALGIEGSPDVMGNLLVLIEALRENNREVVNSVIDGLDDSLDEILNQRATAGAKSIRLETTQLRLTEYSLSFTKLLSEVEDADLTKLVAELAQKENTYKAALQSAAKIIQPTLLDFIG